MESAPKISFENTAIAFHYKSNKALRKAHFIFSLVNHPWVSAVATGFVKFALQAGLPVEGIIRRTAFDHFCGGESIKESNQVIRTLADHNVQTILDYSVEGEKSEAGFNATLSETLRIIEKAQTDAHIPFAVFKITGVGAFDLLEKVQRREQLSSEEELAFERIKNRVNQICRAGFDSEVPVLIDAEESWIQETIDALANEMMKQYNKEKPVIFNTYQLYRTDTLENLKEITMLAMRENFFVGAKLVRGAYMEKERSRAQAMGYPSPIQPDKSSADSAFNQALVFCIDNLSRLSVMCGSHNEESNYLLTTLMQQRNIAANDKRIWFAQLYGMSDNISFNLAKAGYNVAKYVPYGPVKSVMPYLFRRAQENTSVAGQSSRELTLIRTEVRRRKRNVRRG